MLGDLERGFERFVDSAIARGFRLRVQPAEIGRHLERAMENGTATSVGGGLAPNAYLVMLHPEDAAAFDDWSAALCLEMERWLAELAFRRGLVTIAPMQVTISSDTRVRRRSVRASARFLESPRQILDQNATRTAPLELSPLDEEGASPIRVVSRGTLGRGAGNDHIIEDDRVSRRHAVVECDADGWHVCDLGSTNGTWVNGRRVECGSLGSGDELTLGGVRFRVLLE